MEPTEDYLDVLQNIEFAVLQVWRKAPTLNNYNAMRAYDAAIAHYGAIARGVTPKPTGLTGLDATLFDAVKEMCEMRLGRGASAVDQDVPTLPVEDLVSCLRKLRKSVDKWTREGGRQGYLELLKRFVK
jgi:hypothetical protein